MKEYPEVIEQFCIELQELLDRYKMQLEVPTIMRNAQHIFHNTLSIRYHPELHQKTIEWAMKTEKDYLADFIKKGGQAVDELHNIMKKEKK